MIIIINNEILAIKNVYFSLFQDPLGADFIYKYLEHEFDAEDH